MATLLALPVQHAVARQPLQMWRVSQFGVAVAWQMASPVETAAGPSQSKKKKVTTFATKWQKKSSKRK
eukprot:COSAG01_NODE_431_length_17124_cov_26.577386_2_plen_68_part_00